MKIVYEYTIKDIFIDNTHFQSSKSCKITTNTSNQILAYAYKVVINSNGNMGNVQIVYFLKVQ